MTNEREDTGRIKQLFVQGVAWRSLADFLIRLRSIILLPILTRTFGQADYGVWTQISNTVNMLSTLGTFGIGASMQRYIPGLPSKEQRQQFWMSIAVLIGGGLLVALPFLAFAEFIATAFFGGAENLIFVYLGVVLMLSKLLQGHLLLYFRLALKINLYSILLVMQALLSLAAYLAAAILGRELLIVVLVAIAVDLLMTLIVLVAIGRNLGFGMPDFSALRKYLVFGLPTLPLGFLNWALNSSDRYAVAYFLGPSELAVYAVAYGISLWAIQVVVTPLWTVAPSAMNNLWNTDRQDEAIALIKRLFKYYFLAVTPIFSIIVFWGDFLLAEYAGEDYSAGAVIVVYVLLAYLFEYTASFYRQIFVWYERTRVFLWTFSITAAGNLILNLLLIPRLGILGAAIATAAAYTLLLIFEVLISRRIHKVDFPVREALITLIIGLLIAGLISQVPSSGWLGFAWQVALSTGLFGLAAFGLRLISFAEIRAMLALLRNREEAEAQ